MNLGGTKFEDLKDRNVDVKYNDIPKEETWRDEFIYLSNLLIMSIKFMDWTLHVIFNGFSIVIFN